ncbi:hypothetical protein A9Q78_01870 [Methylophaga sp. 41_12_T18]|nr:hypothetical protein A9Q78_01870 [Methylophaga sp. 41_12_T18]
MTNTLRSAPLTTLAILLASSYASTSFAALQDLSQRPLFVANAEKANVLVVLDNSNSMDEDDRGKAVGSDSSESKSEIARIAIRDLINTYTGKINMGLMAYQQYPPGNAGSDSKLHVIPSFLHAGYYDVSYDADANYDPNFIITTATRNSQTKKFQIPNPTSPGNFINYNVTLPYYSSEIQNVSYCYAPDGSAFDDGEVFTNGSNAAPDGPWDFNRCFTTKIGISDALPSPALATPPDHYRFQNWGAQPFLTSTITAAETARGYSGLKNWFGLALYSVYFYPTDSDIAQGIVNFGKQQASTYVSPTWLSNASPGRGYLHIPISDLNTSQASTLNVKLAVSDTDPANNGPTDPILPLQNAGFTPLAGTLQTAKDYFVNPSSLPADEGGGGLSPLPESCDKDFVALLTDGLPSTNENGTPSTNTVAALADVATAATELNDAGVETYTIGFALPVGTEPTALDSIASSGGTNTAYLASDSDSLQATFDIIFSDILAKTGASSSAATNSTSLSSNSFIYQARFNSGDWAGELLAKPISLAGIIGDISDEGGWNAATQLNAMSPASRVILTYGRDSKDGIPFTWTDISAQTDTTAKDLLNTDPVTSTADGLGANRVDYLRGGTGNGSAASFRSDRNGKLGDIVHSTPYYVGAPNAGYNDTEMPDYSTFQADNSSRQAILYTGANDGMLHGFNASTGDEVLAYIPLGVFSKLNLLTASGYGSTVPHRYFVDGAPMVADADVDGWKTILAGGLNGGGQGIYALDVTDPATFAENTAADTVLWEFTDEDDADLGYTYIQPNNNFLTNQSNQIAKMANGEWAVIIGNGYNNTEADGHASSTGHAALFVLFIEKGIDGSWATSGDYIKIDTEAGSTTTPNGLATPTPVDTDGDGKMDTVYAGDLEGNMWKFDLSDIAPSKWTSAFKTGQDPKPLYIAMDIGGNEQAITSAPLVTRHPDGGYLIGFGTGKYLEHNDISSTASQSIYGIWDQAAVVSNRSSLVEQTIIELQTINFDHYRITSSNTVDYTSKKGWFMDLPESGERVDVNPVIRDQRFVFATRTPSSAACVAGGTSWLMELDYLTGGPLDVSPYDVNGDGVINDLDAVEVNALDEFGNIMLDENGDPITKKVYVSGHQDSDGGMLASPTTLGKDPDDEELKILSNSDGQIQAKLESVNTEYKGRVSWEEIR